MGSTTKTPSRQMVQADLLSDPETADKVTNLVAAIKASVENNPAPHPNDDAPCPFRSDAEPRCKGCASNCHVAETIEHEDDCAIGLGGPCDCIAGLTGESPTEKEVPDAQDILAAPSIDLEKILADEILLDRKDYPKEGRLFATDLGIALGPDFSGCPRGFWGKCRDEERRDVSPGTLLMFKMGELVEQYIIELLKRALPKHGWKYRGTQHRYAQYGVSGKLDVLIEHEETGALRIIDVKSKRGQAFGFLNEPKYDNVLQVQFYGDAIETLDRAMQAIPELAESHKPIPAIAGDVLYVDREGSNFVRHFPIEHEPHRPRKAASILKVLRDGPEPEPLLPRLNRKENKGDDSIYLNYPWQVEWCDLKVCPCKKSIGKLPSGICAKVSKPNKKRDYSVLRMEQGCESYEKVVLAMLREQYPNEDIRVGE